ncbi:MAG: chromate resistance protein [Candidatus Pacebacteria bacterium]|nr:chromate resistance protein [Candidatus Paceibacterota bacterium]
MKKVVTHINPDLDAMASVWLIKRFLPGWEKAAVCFVPAGNTIDNQSADSDPAVLHVDTGLGKLDHHQLKRITSATALVWQYIRTKRKHQTISPLEKEALTRIVKVVTEIDNARDLVWNENRRDRFEFYLHSLIYGIKRNIPQDDQLTEVGLMLMDGLLRTFKDKIKAEEKIEREGIKFESRWGRAIALETGNEKVLWEAEIRRFCLVIKYDPDFPKRVKIYARFDSPVDLTPIYKIFKKSDSEADWFLHASKKLLLISSHPHARGTSLSLDEIIKALKK